MACGPHVIKGKSSIDLIKSMEYSLLVINMESYGLALAALMSSNYSFQVIPPVVKGVCDFADLQNDDEWHHYFA